MPLKHWLESLGVSLYESLTRNDPVEPADLIFVMAGRMDRKEYGLELYRSGLAPRLVLSVGRFEVSKMLLLNSRQHAELKALRDNTRPADRHFFVTMDDTGVRMEQASLLRWNTYGEACGLRERLKSELVETIMVISTDVHLRRVALTFAKVFRDVPVRFVYCAVPPRFDFLDKDNWWRDPDDRRFVIKEFFKLAAYRVVLSLPRGAVRKMMQWKLRSSGSR